MWMYNECMGSYHDNLNDLLSDNVSGSIEIACKALNVLSQLESMGEDPVELAEKILRVHGDMIAVEKAVKAFLNGTPAVNILNELRHAGEKAGYELARYLEGTVVTISRSKTVEMGILNADRLDRVYILESRPACEGVRLAESLTSNGIDCRVVVDSAMGYAVKRSDLVVFGADSVFSNGVTNKIGTLPLALTAYYIKRPVLCAFPEIKIVKRPFSGKFSLRNPEEVVADVPAENVYFEFVPEELISWVVTENGRKNFEDLFPDI